MSYESSFGPRLKPEQVDLLRLNSVRAIQNGLAKHYADVRERTIEYFLEEIKNNPASPLAKAFEIEIEAARRSLLAEIPFCFVKNQSTEGFSFGAAKVDINSGALVPASAMMFGIQTHGMTEPERPGAGFTPEDVTFSLESLAAQTAMGMEFHYIDGLQ